MGFLRRFVCALLLLLAPVAAHAEERIHLFVSDARINPDSSLDVTETIDVNSEHVLIRHGIFRDFPTRYKGPRGTMVHVGFTLLDVTLDGQPVPAKVESIAGGVRARIGDPERLVDEGEHRYVLHYRTTRQLGRFTDYDELYWNATGTGWIFPIDVAEARITLPKAVSFGRRVAYTGAYGAAGADFEVITDKPGEIAFRTTRALGAREGLSVAAAFPKGVVGEASAAERSKYWLADFGPPLVGAGALFGLCVFFYIAWARAGRNPRAGTIMPIWTPPDELSPAGMRYVTRMGSDDRAFAAALVDMGVRGHIRIVEEDGGWFSRDKKRIERLAATAPLPPEEQVALGCLVQPGGSVVMEQKNHEKFSSAKKRLDESLKDAYEGSLFKRNYGWAITGVIAFVGAFWLACAAVVAADNGAAARDVVITLGAMGVAALLSMAIYGSSTIIKVVLSFAALGAAALAVYTGLPIFAEALNSGWWLPLLIPALALPLVISCFWWIAAPTRQGRAVLDRIAGFKQYLSITERERLDRMTAPEDTPEIFEKLLPYAIALGVENRWADRFQSVLAAAAAAPGGHGGFLWYSGSDSPWDNPTGFVSGVGSSLASTIGSASSAPGSSSGSGGGGFSGGGGGGGGGGGW
jgi:uncharacterized membrane protein YgcG